MEASRRGSIKFSNRAVFVLAKHKNGYIIPAFLSLKQSYDDGMMFFGKLVPEKHFYTTAYMLCTKNGVIEAISPSITLLFHIDVKSL